MSAPWHRWTERFQSAWLVILHYHGVHARGLRRDVCLRRPDGVAVAVLDRVEIHGGHTRISGRAETGGVRLMTERAQADALPPDVTGPASFQVQIEGALLLRWFAEGQGDAQTIRLYSPLEHVANAARTLSRLVGFAVYNARDIAGFFTTGDPAAGQRLERGLLPLVNAPVECRLTGDLFGAAPLPESRPGADIVIPVHNALTDLRICLDRVAAHIGAEDRVLVIDDASTDPDVAPFLDAWVRSVPQARLLRNPRNLGFVETVNLGLAESRGHVVLLNSDAFVPEGWLDRLLAPILARTDIASVTPMSNDAEIFSIPVICRATDLAPGDGAALDAALARLDWRAALCDAPTGVGFCLALGRPWLDRVSRLDTAFGKGYGEEVDWCRKVAALGGRHVGQGALFVEHGGGRSFSSAKAALVAEGNRLISSRYPGYDRLVSQFQANDPALGPRLAGAIAWLARGGPLPVYIAHSWTGGAEDWLQHQVTRALADGKRGAVLLRALPEQDAVGLEAVTANGKTRATVPLDMLTSFLGLAESRRVVYSSLVGALDPLGTLSAVLRLLTPEDSFGMVFHDFFPLCPSYNLLDADGSFCDLPAATACARCYGRLPPMEWTRPARLADWRTAWKTALDRAQDITVFSPSSKTLVARVWPDLEPRIRIRPHDLLARPDPVPAPQTGPVTLGVLGSIGHAKGAGVVRALASHVGPEFRVVVIGKLAPEFLDPRLVVHGPYDRSQIAAIAGRYGVTCWLVPSIWPETFSFALHECLATGLPVFGFDLGAQGETLRAADNGHVLDAMDDLTPATFAQRTVA